MNQRMMAHMSSALYVGLCHEVGTPTLVNIRRDIQDAKETIIKQSNTVSQSVLSGSVREGFQFSDSDLDWMIWPKNCKVTFGAYSSNLNHTQEVTNILAVPFFEPGFVFLRLITNRVPRVLLRALFTINDDIYISSTLYREEMFNRFRKLGDYIYLHGPCTSSKHGSWEFDFAFCFACHEWPTLAIPWIERCERKGWPTFQILNDIVSNGCHFIPIGARNSPFQQHEWRLSFSIAEKILVTSMTHTQFLCYATLKFFLKEVINIHTMDNMICSYFLKTVLFWELQENRSFALNPCNLLMGFWKCFKHLIKLVYKGDCPNFFIPNNNMFRGKIEGAPQAQLLKGLCKLYNMGISCLLLSPSVCSYLVEAIQNPRMVISTNERNFDVSLDTEVFHDIANLSLFPYFDEPNLKNFMTVLDILLQAKISTISQYRTIAYQRLASQALQYASYFLIKDAYIPNRELYIRDKISCGMLKLAARIGNISDLLYLAMHYYMTRRYNKSLDCVEITKKRLTYPYVMHQGVPIVENWRMYEESVGRLSYSKKMKNAWSISMCVACFCNYINILKLESNEKNRKHLLIPTYVMVSLLSFLCQHGNPQKQDEALYDLQYLLLCDDGCYVTERFRDISWQILGICHQLRGNLYDALYSYQQSLRCMETQHIGNFSHVRILSVITELSLKDQ